MSSPAGVVVSQSPVQQLALVGATSLLFSIIDISNMYVVILLGYNLYTSVYYIL